MNWMDIASIVFVCVTMNHLGLIEAIEDVIDHKLPILDCPKCSSYWGVLAFTLVTTHDVISSLAISFLASYAAIWLELLEGIIDTLYTKIYDKVFTTTDTADDRT